MAIDRYGNEIKGGRPKKEIDKKSFENLCSLQCTKDDMCGFFDVDEKTLTKWCHDTYDMGFSDIYKRKASKGKISLRRMQFRKAEDGNATMQIWLGKQYLGQSDVMRQDVNVTKDKSDIEEEIDNYLKELDD